MDTVSDLDLQKTGKPVSWCLLALAVPQDQLESSVKRKKSRCLGFILEILIL